MDNRVLTVLFEDRTFIVSNNRMATFTILKDPNATLDYYIDWTSWLSSGESIVTSTWTCTNTTITLPSTTNFGTATTTVWVASGIAGEVYNITNRIATSGTRTEERTIQFTVIDR